MLRIALVLTILSLAYAAQAETLRLLFLGNSHTSSHDVPSQVKALLAKPGRTIQTQMFTGGLLQDIAQNTSVRNAIAKGGYDVVVLQGAGLSQSHRYTYPIDGAVTLANLATQSGARPLLFAEWSRKQRPETRYILGIYETIARPTGADTVPICRAFDEALRRGGNLDLWSSDGNHSSPAGAYLAACTLAAAIDAKAPMSFVAPGVDPELARSLREVARSTKVIPPPVRPR